MSVNGELNWQGIGSALLLLLAANGAPVLVAALNKARYPKPVDGGASLRDGRRLFGDSKTWRGLSAAFVATALLALGTGYGWLTGFLFAAGSMTGDLLASFMKRRFNLPEGRHVHGLDTVPESLIPLLMVESRLNIGWLEAGIVVGAFYLIEEGLSPLLVKWRLRKDP